MLDAYRQHVAERAEQGIPPLPLDAKQTAELVELLKQPSSNDVEQLVELLTHRVPPGVDEAAYVKASFLADVATAKVNITALSAQQATFLLGTMLGGYNVQPLIALLDNTDAEVAQEAANALAKTLLVYDAYHDVVEKAKTNTYAQQFVDSWAIAKWFTDKKPLA